MFSFNDILNRIKATIKNEDNRIEGSFSMDNAQAVSQELAMLHSTEIAPIMDNISLDTSTGIYLDRKAIDFNMHRNPPLPAKGLITITGVAGKIIPAWTKVQSNELTFTIPTECLIDESGTVTVMVVCDTSGTIGNISANKIDSFTAVSNIYNCVVTNQSAFSGGVDAESDTAFRKRILEKIQRPITSGNINHYIYWAKQVSGVSEAQCIGCWAGAGTVKVILFSNGGVTPIDVVNEVTNAIELERPIGATVTVVAATAKTVKLDCKLKLWDGTDKLVIATIIKQRLKEYLNIENTDKTYLSYYKISDILFSIQGVTDIISYTINGTMNSVQVADDEFIEIAEVKVNA